MRREFQATSDSVSDLCPRFIIEPNFVDPRRSAAVGFVDHDAEAIGCDGQGK
jgi:hypothetical protein